MTSITDTIKKSYKDSITDCAHTLSNSLKPIDFKLKNRFCDETDLKSSWENIEIPEVFIQFFASFFNFKQEELFETKKDEDCGSNDNSSMKNNLLLLKMKCLYQIFYFIYNKGLEKTSLHTLMGLYVFNTCRSKKLITILNRLSLSITYDEVLRIRTRLAEYTQISCQSSVPLPSHFDPQSYITAAFDNFDHNEASLSGLNATHDAVTVIFQDESDNYDKSKPLISETFVKTRAKTLENKLKCQQIKNFDKLTNTLFIPSDYLFTEIRELGISDYRNVLLPEDFAWSLSRISLFNSRVAILNQNSSQCVPTWSAFNA